MIKQLLNLMILLVLVAVYSACEITGSAPEVSQPIVLQYVDKNVMVVGGDSIQTGPLKDFEQESDVVYRLTVSSEIPLSKFIVKTSSDAFYSGLKILKTEPDQAIDSLGNFTQKLTNVVVYYAYRIHPLVAPHSIVKVDFTFQNESNYVGISSDLFTVIKKGSTNGKLLTVIDMPGYTTARFAGIGNQNNMDILSGNKSEADARYRKGAFYSLGLRSDIALTSDVLRSAGKVDFVGYITKSAGTDPVLTNGSYYLVSPSDTTVLTTKYAGATVTTIALVGTSGTADVTVGGLTKTITFSKDLTTTATSFVTANKAAYAAVGLTLTSNAANLVWSAITKNVGFTPVTFVPLTGTLYGNEVRDAKLDLLASTIRQLNMKLSASGSALRKVYFKRLDNVTGTNNVTPAYFDLLTHDNEFDVLLAGIATEATTAIGPIKLNEVYGFVTDDGRRGLIKTAPINSVSPSGASNATVVPTAGDGVLFCTIKAQEN